MAGTSIKSRTAPEARRPLTPVEVAVRERRTMVPPAELLPQVLPTDRLNAKGMALPPLRTELRRIASVRNALTVGLLWAEVVAVMVATVWLTRLTGWFAPVVWLAAIALLGSFHARLAILGHEAAHKMLFTNKRGNDVVGRWLLSYPTFVPMDIYRRAHFAHHREEFGPEEPDLALYAGYPLSPSSLRRKLLRDARGSSGWKNLKPLLQALRGKASRPLALRILGTQMVLIAICTVAGYPALYLLWLASWMTSWRVLNRLRSIAEHGGLTRGDDRRLTTHHVRQSWLARFWIVPFNTGWHLAHHVDMGVPWRNLPRFHDELVRAGWVVPAFEYPSYVALWRALASRPEAMAAAETGAEPDPLTTLP